MPYTTTNNNMPAAGTNHSKSDRLCYRFFKRSVDLILSLLACPFLIVFLVLIAIAIKCSDGGPVLYKAKRMGKNGKAFNMYKIRTMKDDSDNPLTPEEMRKYKKEYKLKHDPRVTELGSFLRKSSLDELPQLLNVIKSDMSLIGPRPVLDEETYLYGKDREKLLSVKPGITGYWQAYARNNAGYQDGRRQKMELYYVDNRSVLLDMKIFFVTIKRVFSGNGVY